LNKSITIEIAGAVVALVIISLITWLFLALSKRRRIRRAASTTSESPSEQATANSLDSTGLATESSILLQKGPEQKWEVADFLLQTEPLGAIPGTGAERELIVASALALTRYIESAKTQETMWPAVLTRYQQEFATPEVLELIGLEESAEGYAARISYHQKKYTILLGEAEPVALASAPFSVELRDFLARNSGKQVYVLVIDGIAYSAIALELIE